MGLNRKKKTWAALLATAAMGLESVFAGAAVLPDHISSYIQKKRFANEWSAPLNDDLPTGYSIVELPEYSSWVLIIPNVRLVFAENAAFKIFARRCMEAGWEKGIHIKKFVRNAYTGLTVPWGDDEQKDLDQVRAALDKMKLQFEVKNLSKQNDKIRKQISDAFNTFLDKENAEGREDLKVLIEDFLPGLDENGAFKQRDDFQERNGQRQKALEVIFERANSFLSQEKKADWSEIIEKVKDAHPNSKEIFYLRNFFMTFSASIKMLNKIDSDPVTRCLKDPDSCEAIQSALAENLKILKGDKNLIQQILYIEHIIQSRKQNTQDPIVESLKNELLSGESIYFSIIQNSVEQFKREMAPQKKPRSFQKEGAKPSHSQSMRTLSSLSF